MRISMAIVSIIGIIALSGCGGSATISDSREDISKISTSKTETIQTPQVKIPQEMKKANVVEVSKINRANWNGIVALTDGFFITDDETLLSFKIEDAQIASGEARTEDILIDADNNANTGYTNERWGNIGAEYLIEGNNIFSYSGNGADWRWNLLSRIDMTREDNWIEAEFNMNLIQHGTRIRAISGLYNNDWRTIRHSSIVSYDIDNNNNGGGTATFTMSDDDTNIQFVLHNARIQSGEARSEDIFIDADNNPNTGYRNSRWRNIGAEYLIEGNRLYSYGGTGWSWNAVSTIDRVIDGDRIELSFNKNLVNLSPRIRTISGLLNNQWQVVHMYNIQSFNVTGAEDNGGDNGERGVTITDDTTSITLNVQSPRVANATATSNTIFIDTDNNPATGYTNTRWQAQLGAEYMIEGNTLYRHSGAGWSWAVVDRVTRTTDNDRLTIVINKTDLNNLAQTIRVTPYLLNNQWIVIERFDTLSHVNVARQVNNGSLSVTHDIRSFTFTINNDALTNNSNIEIYIDADNDTNTGFRINGMGAEYRVIGNELTRFRMDTRAWVEPINGVVHRMNGHIHTIRISRDIRALYLRRTISVMAILADTNNNNIHTYNPIEYEVRGSDDEITLSLENPDYYIFRIHNRQIQAGELFNNIQSGDLIGVDHFGTRGGGIINNLHLAFDMDLNRFTGNVMNTLGADYWMSVNRNNNNVNLFSGFDRTLVGNGHAWMDRWTESDNGAITIIGNHVIEVLIPRGIFPSGTFNIASTMNGERTDLNGRNGHIAWTKKYEFTIE